MMPTGKPPFSTMFERPTYEGTPTVPDQRPSARSQIEQVLAGYKKPSTTQNVVGYIADALARLGGMPGVYGAQQGEQREKQSMLEQMLLKADLEQEQFAAREKMKAPNRPAVQENYEFLKKINPGAADQYIQNFGAPPMQAVDITNPDGSVMRQYIPRSGPQMPPQAAPGAVDWSKFKPLGGQTPRASGGFRP